MNTQDLFKNLISHAKEYGFIFPSSDIYDGLNAVYDYGQNGVELKKNIKEYWWKAMVYMHDNIVGIESAILMHPTTWKASGHVDAFSDPLIDNKDSKKRYRADVLIEEQIEKYRQKANKEIEKAAKKFGENMGTSLYRSTNPRVIEYLQKADTLETKFKKAIESNDLAEVKQIILDEEIVCPISGTCNWTDVRHFNLMFSTELGSADDTATIYLRPETAQGSYVNFLNVQQTGRMKVPFGIAQIGKAFRNEIVARQFIFRMREFEQMEMQYFVRPGEEMQWYEYWKEARMRWHRNLYKNDSKHRFHNHLKLAHYANAACDIEFDFPFGFKELEGIHSRTDFDLAAHQKYSGKKLQYFDAELNQSYVPYVVETALGLDRMFLSILSAAYDEETLDDGTVRTVLHLPRPLAPIKVAILPLTKKDGLPELAKRLFHDIRLHLNAQYDEKDAIGKRYRRQDAIGTPYCITIDHDSLQDQTVTIRDRDSMQQERLSITDAMAKVISMTHLNTLFEY